MVLAIKHQLLPPINYNLYEIHCIEDRVKCNYNLLLHLTQ